MKKVNNRIIKGVLCLVTLSTMLIGQNNILTKGYAQDTYSEVAGESHTAVSYTHLLDELPELAEEKVTLEQIKMCFKAHFDDNWQCLCD